MVDLIFFSTFYKKESGRRNTVEERTTSRKPESRMAAVITVVDPVLNLILSKAPLVIPETQTDKPTQTPPPTQASQDHDSPAHSRPPDSLLVVVLHPAKSTLVIMRQSDPLLRLQRRGRRRDRYIPRGRRRNARRRSTRLPYCLRGGRRSSSRARARYSL